MGAAVAFIAPPPVAVAGAPRAPRPRRRARRARTATSPPRRTSARPPGPTGAGRSSPRTTSRRGRRRSAVAAPARLRRTTAKLSSPAQPQPPPEREHPPEGQDRTGSKQRRGGTPGIKVASPEPTPIRSRTASWRLRRAPGSHRFHTNPGPARARSRTIASGAHGTSSYGQPSPVNSGRCRPAERPGRSSIGGAVEREDLVAADVARVVVEEASDRVGLVGHGGEVVFGHAEPRQPRLQSEIGVPASDARGDVVLVGEAKRVEDVRSSISYGGGIEGERVREYQRAGQSVGDMVARAERVGDGVAGGGVHGPEAEAAVQRRQREPGAGFAVGAVADGAREVAADQP